MPIYEYECPKCGVFEYSQAISDDPLKRCPTCRRAVTKLLSASAFHLKGGGWYADGYAKGAAKNGDTPTSPATSSSDTTPEAAKPAKPAGKAKPSSGKAS